MVGGGSACGAVEKAPVDGSPTDGPGGDGAAPATTTLSGGVASVPPVTFGGPPFCMYTVTLKQLSLEIDLRGGQAVAARTQHLGVEETVPPCTFEPQPPSISRYTLDSATGSAERLTLTMRGDPANAPTTSLTIELTSVGDAHEATLGWKRIDQGPPLDWAVIAKLTLSPT